MGRLDGKVAVLTGAGGWIGSHTAKIFAREGASVVCVDISQEKLNAVVNEITAAGGTASSIVTDITDESQVKRMIDFAVEKYGKLDVLQNLATYTPAGDTNVVRTSNEVWETLIKVNMFGTIWGCKYAIPKMLENGSGSIINMDSSSGFYGNPQSIAYGTTKAAISAITRYVAAAYSKRGIRANAIAPFFAGNPGMDSRPGGREILEVYEQHTLTPRLGRPTDQGNLALFLASDESFFITGQTIRCDGGISVLHPTSPGVGAAIKASRRKSAEES